MGAGGSLGGRGSGVGRIVSSTKGGRPGVVGPAIGLMGESGSMGVSPTCGG